LTKCQCRWKIEIALPEDEVRAQRSALRAKSRSQVNDSANRFRRLAPPPDEAQTVDFEMVTEIACKLSQQKELRDWKTCASDGWRWYVQLVGRGPM